MCHFQCFNKKFQEKDTNISTGTKKLGFSRPVIDIDALRTKLNNNSNKVISVPHQQREDVPKLDSIKTSPKEEETKNVHWKPDKTPNHNFYQDSHIATVSSLSSSLSSDTQEQWTKNPAKFLMMGRKRYHIHFL